MTSPEKILDYDKLVEDYSVNLDVNLRGFRPAEEMLDTWVPDEDPVRSLCNLVEAGQLCGSETLKIRVSQKTLPPEAAQQVCEKLAGLGEVTVEKEADSLILTMSHLQQTALFRSVRPIYQQKLRARSAALQFKRPLKSHENQIALRAVQDEISLAWSVQNDQHVITDAVHDGPGRGPVPAILDFLCEILIGLPIQEARDHAIVRLEFALRAPKHSHPIAGIVLPQNADRMFQLPTLLVRRLFDDYIHSTNYRPTTNFFDPGPRPAWAAMSHEQREEQVNSVVAANRETLEVHNGDLQVVECKRPYAVTIRFGDRMSIPAKRKLALAVERLVREKCDPRLEVFCEEKKDLSKIRRTIEKTDL